MKFIDEALVFIKAGDGGDGIVSFRRERNNPRGGPDGGAGGNGGSLIFKASLGKSTLLEFKYQDSYLAEKGTNGGTNDRTGANGCDLTIPVPIGTIVKNQKTDEVIVELLNPDEEIVVLKGGRGGKGNAFFVNSSRQAPDFAQKGNKVEGLFVKLELKLLADVGIIGMPSVGKSTLISKISSAKPKIAEYHFTTLIPNLGVVKYFEKTFVVADVPGLIKDAHLGTGLGIGFLKHIQRSKILLHLVDVSSFENPIENIKIINNELFLFSEDLILKKMLYVLSKMDAVNPEYFDELLNYFDTNNLDYVKISAVSGEGLDILLEKISKIL